MKETAAAPSVTRRHLLLGSAAVIAVAAAGGGYYFWTRPAVSAPEPPGGADVPMAELMAPPPLGDESLGSANAPVTIIEYASMTCPHCAHFHETTFPELKKKYIDTGKVRFIFREFPLDQLAAAGAMLVISAEPARNASATKACFIVNPCFILTVGTSNREPSRHETCSSRHGTSESRSRRQPAEAWAGSARPRKAAAVRRPPGASPGSPAAG